MSESTRALAAKIAANTRWSEEPNRSAATATARAAFMARFENQVDPDGKLAPDVRERLAENARKAHFQRLALKSAKARRGKRNAAEASALASELRAAAAALESGQVDA